MQINTFLIGVQKAGTSTFWNWLSQHPDVYAPEVMKDFHYFNRNQWHRRGSDYLHSFYTDYANEKIVMHGGVNYYFEPEFIENHLAYNSNSKYILILRDPIERAWSAYQYFSNLGNETRTFGQAIDDELDGRNRNEDRHMFAYLEHGLYAKYLKILFNSIPKERFLILFYENLFRNPDHFLLETFKFLELDPLTKINTDIVKNKTGQVKYPVINKILFTKKGIVGIVKRTMPVQKLIPLKYRIKLGYFVRDFNTSKTNSKSLLESNDRKPLKVYFKLPNQELEELLNKDLSKLWGN